jgi:hypothetical protein
MRSTRLGTNNPRPPRPCLAQITLRGFKTIRDLADFEPGNLTVLIGPNGAGKSNFISFFRLLSWALAPPGQLQFYIQDQGGASALLHQGASVTQQIEAVLNAQNGSGSQRVWIPALPRVRRHPDIRGRVVPVRTPRPAPQSSKPRNGASRGATYRTSWNGCCHFRNAAQDRSAPSSTIPQIQLASATNGMSQIIGI